MPYQPRTSSPAADEHPSTAAPDQSPHTSGDNRVMASASRRTFEEQVDRLLAAADDFGALFRFRTVRDLAHSDAINRLARCDLARDELILTFPDGRREGFDLGPGGLDRLVEAGIVRRCSPM